MFNANFYPTPISVIEMMLDGVTIEGKVILEPSAGKGDIVDYLIRYGAENVIACEKHLDLKKIVETKCKVISDDFMLVESHQISHIDIIVMNPPFNADEKHILHAWEIAPPGCKIIAICNTNTLTNNFNSDRRRLKQIVKENGSSENIGDCFSDAERETGVEVSIIRLQKAGADYENEFEGFFMEDDVVEQQINGLIPYNFIRDIVNRYVESVKLFDKQIELAIKMNSLTIGYFFKIGSEVMSFNESESLLKRNEFKKDLQKSGWDLIFKKMNMGKFATRGLKEDINKFVEQQQNIPFTMRNIYKMLEIVIATQSQRMDKCLLEVFVKLTMHYHDNRFNVEGWKSNSHYLITKQFVIPYMAERSFRGGFDVRYYNGEIVEDMMKALCHITGDDYNSFRPLTSMITDNRPDWGKWFDWGYFEVKAFKKGTMHFRFKSEDIWGKFNQHIARIKGFPLYESKTQTSYQNRNSGRKKEYGIV